MSVFLPPTLYGGRLWAGRKVGLLGGSFNPAHDGHRHISLLALQRLGLDAVWWLVSPQNPLKSTKDMAPLAERLQSALDASRHPRLIPTALETELGTRYTCDTLAALRRYFPATRFAWLMGSDNLHQFHLWNDWQDIFGSVPVAVFARPPEGDSIRASPAGQKFRRFQIDETNAAGLACRPAPCWTILHTPLNPLSATKIRESRRHNKKQ